MPQYTRDEIEKAFQNYCALRERASETGDWSIWADQFTEDAGYVEHAYGEFKGRDAIREWITQVMAPFPHMTFPNDWYLIDESQGSVVFQCQNRLEHPTDPDGPPFEFPTWSLIRYAGNQQWSYEEDMYNPKDGATAIGGWHRAGGKFESPELVKMTNA